MVAAISAARQGAKTVRLIEKNSILGRKLLATGNGRCNLTNTNCRESEVTLRFFAELGLLTRAEAEGRVYPYSEQATAVQEALISELRNLKVEVLCNFEVQAIDKANPGFQIISGKDRFYSESVILTTGGKAGPQYGSAGDGYRFAKALGHHVVGPRPSLVQMVSDRKFFKELKGVRAKGQVDLLRGDEVVDRESGEIQFTEDGLSGICIFNLSKEYALGDIISIDLFPDYSEEALEDMFINRKIALHSRRLAEYFDGMLNKKLIPVLLAELTLDLNRKAAGLSRGDITRMVSLLKSWRITITGTKGWKEAQVTSGGVDLAEIDLNTMESVKVPNLYIAGELVNVDEKCGGYNLQWAWSSGMTAGKSAAMTKGRRHAENT